MSLPPGQMAFTRVTDFTLENFAKVKFHRVVVEQ